MNVAATVTCDSDGLDCDDLSTDVTGDRVIYMGYDYDYAEEVEL